MITYTGHFDEVWKVYGKIVSTMHIWFGTYQDHNIPDDEETWIIGEMDLMEAAFQVKLLERTNS